MGIDEERFLSHPFGWHWDYAIQIWDLESWLHLTLLLSNATQFKFCA
jgi:hypothetical protein